MRTYFVTVNGTEHVIAFAPDGKVIVDGRETDVEVKQLSPQRFSALLGTSSYTVTSRIDDSKYQLTIRGTTCEVGVESERARKLRDYAGGDLEESGRLEIHAPMPALVVRLLVQVGDAVQEGTGLIVLEAMKMENEIKADRKGMVKEIRVSKGTPVEKGELLMLLEE